MSNMLLNEKSPYLRQHADNPVNWYPWCEEAFDRAKRENRPVFLSIGYSTCHWCHVMAHESFEDQAVADILNNYYIPVKVDREERPDVDSVYMSFCIAANGSGGWPLTVVMTPEQQPFFAGTYIPRSSGGGRIGLIPLLSAIAKKWQQDERELRKTASDMTRRLNIRELTAETDGTEELLSDAVEQLKAAYDKQYGGFGSSPKFPTPQNLLLLLRAANAKGDRSLRSMADFTLQQMYRGGIYDHFGGGFCRYSTDREWLAPHFEKTLYDNALLSLAYIEAWQDGHFALYRDIAENTLDYCLRELKAPGGGYYCGQDADSGGVEGAYYLFTPDEVKKVLGEDAGRGFCECYDILPEGNFHGLNIPNLLINQRWNLVPEGYDEYRERLRLYREERMTLLTDTKLLTSWNGMLLMALSRGAKAFGDPRYLMEAKELASFMGEKLYSGSELMERLCGGELKYDAQLDDYVYYALGLLELYNADFDLSALERAAELADTVLREFKCPSGGFYRTGNSAEKLIVRPVEIFDNASPSGNSAAAVLFDLLFRYTGQEKWRDATDSQLRFICGSVGKYPAGAPFAFLSLLSALYGTRELVCVSPDDSPPRSLEQVTARYSPDMTVTVKTPSNAEKLAALAPFTAHMTCKDNKPTYYLCQNGACARPVTEL